MLIDRLFPLAIEFCRRVVGRRVFDGLTSQIDRDLGLWPTHVSDPLGCDEHTVTAPPIARVHNEVANRPAVIVNEQILQVADITVRRLMW